MLKEMWGEEVPRHYDAPEPTKVGSSIHVWQTSTGTPDEVINVVHNIVKSIHIKFGQQSEPLNYIKLAHGSNGWLLWNPYTDDKWMTYTSNSHWWVPKSSGGGMELVPMNSAKINAIIKNWV